VREEYWRELRNVLAEEARALTELNAKKAEQLLRDACSDWEAWLSQEGEAAAADHRAESLAEAISRGMPARPAARAVREALNASRMARIRWDGSLSAAKAELKLVSEDLAMKAQAGEQAGKVDDTQLQQTREAGRMRGQTEALQKQLNEFIDKEKKLKDQISKAKEQTLRGQQELKAESAKAAPFHDKIISLEREIASLEKGNTVRKSRKPGDKFGKKDSEDSTAVKPKCTCNVM
jgi:hypothetical protein